MTGRAAGYCAGYNTPGFANPAPGFGRGVGFARGFGRGRGFARGAGFGRGVPAQAIATMQPYGYQNYQPVQMRYTKEQEMADLKAEKEIIERDINAMHEEIKSIETKLKDLETKK